MTESFTTVAAQMPREGDINNVGIYPERKIVVVGGGSYIPTELMLRPYNSVPDIDIGSTYQRNGQLYTLTAPNPKAIEPSPKLLALLSRSVKKN